MQIVLYGAGMYPERDCARKRRRARGHCVEHIGERMRRVGKRRIELRIPVLDWERQDDSLHPGKTGAQVADSGTALHRMPLQRKGTNHVAVGVQHPGQMGLPDIAADNRKGRGSSHNKTSFVPFYAPRHTSVRHVLEQEKPLRSPEAAFSI